METQVDTTQLVSGFDDAADRLGDMDDVAQAAADIVFARADPDTPRRTGQLAASGHPLVVAGAGVVTYTAPYAGAVHAKNPWLARALAAAETDVIDAHANAVADTLDHIHT